MEELARQSIHLVLRTAVQGKVSGGGAVMFPVVTVSKLGRREVRLSFKDQGA